MKPLTTLQLQQISATRAHILYVLDWYDTHGMRCTCRYRAYLEAYQCLGERLEVDARTAVFLRPYGNLFTQKGWGR